MKPAREPRRTVFRGQEDQQGQEASVQMRGFHLKRGCFGVHLKELIDQGLIVIYEIACDATCNNIEEILSQ